MSWRTVVIVKRCKLDLKMGYLVIRGEETRRVFLDEIAVVILENPAVSLTACLMNALVEKKIRLILCGNNRLPVAEMTPCYPELDTVFEIGEELICTMVIENQDFFRAFLSDLNDQVNGLEGKALLCIDGSPDSFSANAELIDSYLGFSINRKSLINKVIGSLERKAVCEAYLQTAELLGAAERLVMELSDHLPCDLICRKLSFGNLLRGIGVELAEDGADPLEKLLDYMELVREFDREKLYFLVNLRSWYPDEKVELFLQSVLGHGHRVMLIDNRDYPRLPLERRVTVDSDLCEF